MTVKTVLSFSLLLLAMTACESLPKAASPTCFPLGYDKAALLDLREKEFAVENDVTREKFAFELLDCLGAPDPEIRDKVAYEGFAALLRNKSLSDDAVRRLADDLIFGLETPDVHDDGFQRSFAALVLSEVARADRIDEILSVEQRDRLVTVSTGFMRSIKDYRGFDEKDGWRHAVAHTADLLMQLSLNENVTREHLIEIRDSVAVQIIPPALHFYIYGEPERLARPILFIANRDIFTKEEWSVWFKSISSPAPFESWSDVYFSQAGLAKRHNLKAFANALYVNAASSDRAPLKPIEENALLLLRALQ